jgi:thiamine monophosphate synthase
MVAVGSAILGGAVTLLALRSEDSPTERARVLAEAISEAMNCSAFLFLVGAPIAVLVAYRRQRAR